MKTNAGLSARDFSKLESFVESTMRAGRIPGCAIALVSGELTVYAKGFGYRDLKTKSPMTADTLYPIASTTKPMNAALLGMLVEEGRVEWDAPVQRYIPGFRLGDDYVSAHVTLRDLVLMRTGLPRHDWTWLGNPTSREALVRRLAHLPLSTSFRNRFQYCNLTVTASGHVAERVAGEDWESLIGRRLFRPLGMRNTHCGPVTHDNQTASYHETGRRQLIETRRLAAEATAPSGGAIRSTVVDMARWVAFNLMRGRVRGKPLISEKTMAQLHGPHVALGERPLAALPPDGAYSLGWVVSSNDGQRCLSHGGYLYDVSSSVAFFPDVGIGIVCFLNFGCSGLLEVMIRSAFEIITGRPVSSNVEHKLASYEEKIANTRRRAAAVTRVPHTRPSQSLQSYVGHYEHPGYGGLQIQKRGRGLLLKRGELRLALKHWHYDVWVAEDDEMWAIHTSHAFDRAARLQFHSDVNGVVQSLSIPLEPEVEPIRFSKQHRGRLHHV